MRLNGARVLVVEDEYLLSLTIQDFLKDIGCQVVGAVGNLEDALVKSNNMQMDAAMLDVNLGGEPTYAVAAVLTSRHIPFLLATGQARAALPPELKHVPVLAKPFCIEQLEAVLQSVLWRGAPGFQTDCGRAEG